MAHAYATLLIDAGARMSLLFPPILLFFSFLLILIFRLSRLKPAILWLVGFSGALLAWISALILRSRLPISLTLFAWKLPTFPAYSPEFNLDQHSWPFVAAVSCLCLASLMISLVNQASLARDQRGWIQWSALLALSSISLCAILPGDLITLIICLTGLDLIEYGSWSATGKGSQSSTPALIFLTSRLAGTMMMVWVASLIVGKGGSLSLGSLDAESIPLMLIAIGVRAGVFPPNSPPAASFPSRLALGVLTLLAPQAANLAALTRIVAGADFSFPPFWLLGVALAVLFSSSAWLISAEERPAWGRRLVIVSGLALAAGSQALDGAAVAWGAALLLAGALWMLASFQTRSSKPMLLLAGISLSSLPFTLTWQGVWLYGSPLGFSGWLFLVSQLCLLTGYLRFAFQSRPAFPQSEPWKAGMYFVGLSLLVVMILQLTVWQLHPGLSTPLPTLLESWPAFLLAVLSLASLLAFKRFQLPYERLAAIYRSLFSPGWALRWISRLLRPVAGFFAGVNFVLEGQAGVLWAILIFILLVSIMFQLGSGA